MSELLVNQLGWLNTVCAMAAVAGAYLAVGWAFAVLEHRRRWLLFWPIAFVRMLIENLPRRW